MLENFVLNGEAFDIPDVAFSDGIFIKEKLFLTGKKDALPFIASLSENLTDPVFEVWGDTELFPETISFSDSMIIIGGKEIAEEWFQYTPFFKSFDFDLKTSKIEEDVLTMDIGLDSATMFVDQVDLVATGPNQLDTVRFVYLEFYNMTVQVKNNSNSILTEVTLNSPEGFIDGGICGPSVKSEDYSNLNLAPGQDTILNFGDIKILTIIGQIPAELQFCVWVATPNNSLDSNNANDKLCKDLPYKNISSVSEKLPDHSIKIYPNPVSSLLNLEVKNFQLSDAELQVYTPFGETVFYEKLQNGNFTNQLNISKLKPGIYFLKYKTEEGYLVKKFIKE